MSGPTDSSPAGTSSGDQGWNPYLAKAVDDLSAAQGSSPRVSGPWPDQDNGYPLASGYEAQPDRPAQAGYPVQAGYPAHAGYPAQGGYPVQPAYPVPYGYQGHQGYGAPAPTNGMAIASLVTGLLGWTAIPLISSLAAIVLGHVARAQIRRTGEQGRGMALAGLILGYIGIVVQGAALTVWILIIVATVQADVS